MYLPTVYTYLSCIHWCVCFHADYCSIISAGFYIIFIHCFHAFLYCSHCFLLLHSHMTSTIYYSIISVIVIHSYKIPLCLWHIAYLNFMYVAVIGIKMCLPVNNTNKCVAKYEIAWKGDKSSWLNMFYFHALKEYLNLLSNTNKSTL